MGWTYKIITAAGKLFFPSLLWNIPTREKVIYLTFDDGPVPEITPWVLSLLKDYHATATFFCIGENVKKHPEIFNQVLAEDHRIGNHTYNHLHGWKTSTHSFVENVLLAEEIIGKEVLDPVKSNINCPLKDSEEFEPASGLANSTRISKISLPEIGEDTIPHKLFRPPYGKIKYSQVKQIEQLGYKIIMWEVISGDYNNERSANTCYKEVVKNTKAGSIVVFHDSIKASENLKKVLPAVLEYYKKEGFVFRSL